MTSNEAPFPLPSGNEREHADERFRLLRGAEDHIPEGVYCYKPGDVVVQGGISIARCPYWGRDAA